MLQGRTRKDGITLIALIVTIVILLILSAVTIIEVKETALFGRAKDGAKRYKVAQIDEQNKMDKWANDVDIWANVDNGSEGGSTKPDTKPEEKPKPGTEVKNTLKVGDYVVYNVQYTDACKKDTNFTENNGWRVIEPGRELSDGTRDGVKIIPTGIPVRLYYDYRKIMGAQGENYEWKGSNAEVAVFKKKCGYVSTKNTDAGVTAATGLSNLEKFGAIRVLKGSSGVTADNGKAWREVIKHNNEEVVGETSLANLMIEENAGESIECPDLEIVKRKMNEKPGGREFITNRSTDEDVLNKNSNNNCLFKTEDDAALGFWNLQDLGIGQYQKGKNDPGWWYWIASPYSPNGDYLRIIDFSGADGCFSYGCSYNAYGLRPIVSLKSGIKVHKSEFQGN